MGGMTVGSAAKRVVTECWIVILVGAACIFSSCAIGDFFSQRYENSIAYFNTYYNATRLFDEAVLEIETTEKNQQSKGLPPQKEISPTARQKLTRVIEKCSKLLQYYPTSKWVDDALMLIGESYYYMGEYLKAERKFAELIAQFPDSEHYLEARLWLGESFRKSNDEDRAVRELTAVADTALVQSEHAIAAKALIQVGEIETEREDYDAAIRAYQRLIDRADYDELKSAAQFRLAHLEEIAGDYGKAAEAYRKVGDYDPDSYTRYQSQLLYAVNKKKTKDYDEARRVLFDLLEDRSNFEYFPQIKLEIANLYNERGDFESAVEAYTSVDTTYRRTDAAAKAYYQLGLLYQEQLHNLVAADTNFAKARAEFPGSEITPLATKHADDLTKYRVDRKMISDLDSLIFLEHRKIELGGDTLSSVQLDSLADTTKTKADSLWRLHAELSDSLADTTKTKVDSLWRLHTELSDSLADTTRTKVHKAWQLHTELWDSTGGSVPMRTLKGRLAAQTYDLGVLFFLDLSEPDSATYWCNKTVALSADSELSARALYTLAEIQRTSKNEAQVSVDSLYDKILSDFPDTKYADQVRRIQGIEVKKSAAADSAEIVYGRAEELIEEKKSAEAISELREIIRRYPLSPFSAKSQYAIGWIYENMENLPDSALQNYQYLAKQYPASVYARAISPELAARQQWEAQTKARQDSASADSLQQMNRTTLNNNVQPQKNALPDSSVHRGLLNAEGPESHERAMEEGAHPMDSTKREALAKAKQDTTFADSLLHKEANPINNNPQPRGAVQPDSSAHPPVLNAEKPASEEHMIERGLHRMDSTMVDSTRKIIPK
jgi:tetratricopeptide (TPR) repeat protein